jgi:thioredoxin-related protein
MENAPKNFKKQTMKKIMLITLGVMAMAIAHAQTNKFEVAEKNAKDSNKLVLLNFSGSDWCIPCIKMHRDIFENDDFKKATDSLVIFVNADFPRMKKHQADAATQKQNDALADKYNNGGAFPYTLLIDGEGKVLKAWSGLPTGTASDFAKEIQTIYNNHYK